MSATSTLSAKVNRGASDRQLCAGVAMRTALIVFVGFAQTYYLKVLFRTPLLRLLPHIHGLLMTAWHHHKRFMVFSCLSILLRGLDRLPLQLIDDADQRSVNDACIAICVA
jgi:hypothetical protein